MAPGLEAASVVSPLRRRLIAARDVAMAESLEQPWVWSQRDCALWAANVLRGPLGRDPCERFRGRYTTARGYLRILRRDGFASLEEAIDSVAASFGWPRIAPADAEPCDLGLATEEQTGQRACVLNLQGGFWVGFRPYGHGVMGGDRVVAAWKVA